MAKINRDTLFKPNLSKAESKAESVSRIAMSMIGQEMAARDAKMARLREARLADEAARQAAKAPPKAVGKAGAKTAGKTAVKRRAGN
ncbi:hypothetical protein MWN33_03600 [Starkeya koreensis]|uniref:Transcriptional regulator n=1 Tax=Ancylobacter koreensis TaxID=266121 RepID=A0ABT0DIT5_9HYPH|nr:hypothetical protein [Ancylobacter koreensis]MCK0207114.1 hypothetical protein [Ancylobacter koreensis]